jgi:hypothetical protein
MKRACAGLAVGIGTCLAAGSAHAAAACGDLNNSGGAPNVADVVLLFRAALENPDPSPLCGGSPASQCGDMNDDGAINVQDVVILFNSVLGNETLFDLCDGEGSTIACPGGTTTISGNITTNQVWPAGCNILLDGTIFVEPETVLTIRPGATIRGKKNPVNPPPSALIFRRESKINAVGSAGSPIIFTSDQAPGTRTPGDWAGLAINGSAPVNCDGGECDAEGLEDVKFGGNQSNDSSGIARFLRVEFAGRELAPDNELNVFTMNGLGRGTTLDHIHAHMGLDDGLEWFGGTVNSKFMISSGGADDQLDWQMGFVGATQFAVAIQYGNNLDTAGSRGFEGDNNEDNLIANPRSKPKFCNVTLVGAKGQPGEVGSDRCAELRRGTSGIIEQTICSNFLAGGIRMSDAETCSNACSAGPALTGELTFSRSILHNVGAGAGTTFFSNNASCTTPCNTTSWGGLQADLRTGVDPGLPGGCGTTFGCIPVGSRPAVNVTGQCASIDPFFENTDYIGAFDPDDGSPGWATSPWVNFATN